jgi:hypothetical protein
MKTIASLVIASSALFCLAAQAQYVKGNEATEPGKKVETPPVPSSVSKVCEANAKCHAGAWRMVETDAGLMECTEQWARPGSCRASSYGSQKLARVWVVKHNNAWAQCQYPDLGSKCTPIFARPPANLPFDAVQ